jgi:hypothetical protein
VPAAHFPGHLQRREILAVGAHREVIERCRGTILHLHPDRLDTVAAKAHAEEFPGLLV